SEVVTGPPARIAFDAEGKPTKAAAGFAAKLGVPATELTVVEVPGKGAYAAARRAEKGQGTLALLPRLLPEIIRSIPWKKSMRWGSRDETFVRPVHWLVALYGGEVVPFELFGIRSDRLSRGHRFLAPGSISLDGTLDDYCSRLREAFVVVEPKARRTLVEAQLALVGQSEPDSVLGTSLAFRIRRDDELLDEVTNLVEYPTAVVGRFDECFLDLPAEVIVAAMRTHQRYFATEKEDGSLAPAFVTIAGTVTPKPAVVQHGNERVLRARLADARFFFAEDRRTPLASMAAKLGGVVFQAQLGSVAEKVERIRRSRIAETVGIDPAQLDRAALLCKADLVSKIVGEFPELQGIIGQHYARLAGEQQEVADAIFEHYLPRGAGDRLPRGALGAALGIADRLDTIAGCFAVGLQPTGSADPFGLRRAALAVLNILIGRGWRFPLRELLAAAGGQIASKVPFSDEVAGQVLDFFAGRLRGLLCEGKELPTDCVDAALTAGWYDVPDALARAEAVSRLRERPDFEPLGIAFKRVANILKGEKPRGEPDAGLWAHPSERALWERFVAIRQEARARISSRDYDAALRELALLKPEVDRFFDNVMVMDKDPALRNNRLALLGSINATFNEIADFRQLAVKT
ncbi:MAG: glycine--tRNA ligase subunit beta, partial [Pseudomonadota bacterium]